MTLQFTSAAGNPIAAGGVSLEVHIRFGGVFASPEPISTTWPQYNYYDPYAETTTTISGAEFSIEARNSPTSFRNC
jgi:hypothetical protein